MTAAEKEQAKKIYFERCAGCHGVLRKGATGRTRAALEQEGQGRQGLPRAARSSWSQRSSGKDHRLRYRWRHGELRRHPTKGRNHPDVEVHPEHPDVPPEFSLKDNMDTWKVIVPVEDRPKKQMNNFNLKNMFSVTLRDTGEVALIDGDTRKSVPSSRPVMPSIFPAFPASGRYVYVIGRDGRLSLIDLWMEKPAVVAKSRSASMPARSIPPSSRALRINMPLPVVLLAAPVRDHGWRHAEAAQGRFHPWHDR